MLIEGTKWQARRHLDSTTRLSLEGEFSCEDPAGLIMQGRVVGLVLLSMMGVVVVQAVVAHRTASDRFEWKSSGEFFPSVLGKVEGSKCFLFIHEETNEADGTKRLLRDGVRTIEEALRRI